MRQSAGLGGAPGAALGTHTPQTFAPAAGIPGLQVEISNSLEAIERAPGEAQFLHFCRDCDHLLERNPDWRSGFRSFPEGKVGAWLLWSHEQPHPQEGQRGSVTLESPHSWRLTCAHFSLQTGRKQNNERRRKVPCPGCEEQQINL